MAIAGDGPQAAVTKPGDGGREGVVGIVLGRSRRSQQTHPGSQGGWHVDDLFAGADQLLSEQPAETGGGLDRPHPVAVKWLSPRQQTIGLMPIGAQRESCQLSFVAINRDDGVSRLVGIDSDRDGHEGPPFQRVDRRGGHS